MNEIVFTSPTNASPISSFYMGNVTVPDFYMETKFDPVTLLDAMVQYEEAIKAVKHKAVMLRLGRYGLKNKLEVIEINPDERAMVSGHVNIVHSASPSQPSWFNEDEQRFVAIGMVKPLPAELDAAVTAVLTGEATSKDYHTVEKLADEETYRPLAEGISESEEWRVIAMSLQDMLLLETAETTDPYELVELWKLIGTDLDYTGSFSASNDNWMTKASMYALFVFKPPEVYPKVLSWHPHGGFIEAGLPTAIADPRESFHDVLI